MGYRSYTIHERAWSADMAADAALVKEGFSWPAFVFGPFWALWHSMWKTAIVLFVLAAALSGGVEAAGLTEAAGSAVTLAAQTAIGLWANDWRRRVLDRQGCVERGAVHARGLAEAEARYVAGAGGAGALGGAA
jgi:hypothetical protein